MFSIEKTLEEIIHFFKKFAITGYTVLFHSNQLLSRKAKLDVLIRPSLFMLIAMVLFLAFVQLNLFFITDPLHKIISNYLNFLDDQSIVTKVLYVIPLGFFLYLFVHVTGKLLFRQQPDLALFKAFNFYWIGVFLLFYLVVAFVMIGIGTSFTPREENIKTFNLIFRILHYAIYAIPLLFCAAAIIHYRKSQERLGAWFGFVFVPFFAVGSVLLCIWALKTLLPYTSLAEKPTINLIGVSHKDVLTIEAACEGNPCKSIDLQCRFILQNKGKEAMIIKNGEELYLKAYYANKDKVEWGDSHQKFLIINKMNNDSISTLKIVKAGDLLEVEAHATLQQADWENFLNATQKNEKGNYEVWFQYFGSNTGEEEHTFDAIVEVAVKNITKVAAAKKSMREDGITKGNIIHRN